MPAFGETIMLKLNHDDGRALDMLLELRAAGKSPTDPQNGGRDLDVLPEHLKTRLLHVQRVMGLLDAMPAEDPSSDLVARTIQLLERQEQLQPAAAWPFALTTEPLADFRPQA